MEPNKQRYEASLAKGKAFLAERRINTAFENDQKGYTALSRELSFRGWDWEYQSSGRGFQVSARKGWFPSTTQALKRFEGDTMTNAFIRVLAQALRQDEIMRGWQVGTQFPYPPF